MAEQSIRPHFTFTAWRQRLYAAAYARMMRRYEQYIEPVKQDLFRDVRGRVLEIGPGRGANLRYLNHVDHWIAVEPNPFMHSPLTEALKSAQIPGQLLTASAEAIPLDDDTVDCVVGTLVLCSVPQPLKAINEVARVLKPGGRFYFIEHVAAPAHSWLRRFQSLASPVCRCCADGCRPNRTTGDSIAQAGFENLTVDEFRVPFPPIPPMLAPHISGTATKRADVGARSSHVSSASPQAGSHS